MSNPVDDPRFTASASGRFRERRGAIGRGAPHSHKKLCLVATDLELLKEMLYGLSLRADCYFVKYGVVARDGMYVGRCSLATDEAAGELCQALKSHPHLMVSLQDDGWFGRFREAPVPAGACGVWDAWDEHDAKVAATHEAAFGRREEAALIAAVRAAGQATISLRAWRDERSGSRQPAGTSGKARTRSSKRRNR